MATSYKILAQDSPAANTDLNLYTVPASTQTVCSTMTICNTGVTATFRVAIRKGGAALGNSMYIIFDNYVNQYDSVFLTLGFSLAAGDIVTVRASTATVSFNLFGAEIA